jgi:hypothetical protein
VRGKVGIWLKKLTKKEVSLFRKDVIIFAFFLFLSFIFWYLNSLRKDIEIDIKYPVQYINPPKDRVISNDPPSKLIFSLKGPGYSIIKLKISGNRAPVVIDFSKVTYKRLPDSGLSEYYIVSSGLARNFRQQLRTDFEIISVKPDTLFFVFDKKKSVQKSDNTSIGIIRIPCDVTTWRLAWSDVDPVNEMNRK